MKNTEEHSRRARDCQARAAGGCGATTQVFRAAWILPIVQPPIRDGWVAVERGRILGVGGGAPPPKLASARVQELSGRAVLPGLVNAHVHLELSWMAGRIRRDESMPAWASRLIALRRTVTEDPTASIRTAVTDARASGTVLVGDITNTLAAYDALVDSELCAAIFLELLGFNVRDPDLLVAKAQARLAGLTAIERLRPSVVPHAPYSVSPSLFRAIAKSSAGKPLSVHVAESPEELQLLHDGTGAWRDLLADLQAWNDDWRPPGCGAVEYLAGLGLVDERLIAVHGVQLTDDELRSLATADATLVTCPRSNAWTGAGSPPIDRFYRSGVRVAIGTDSLAGVEDLNLFHEIAAVRALTPGTRAARLLESATRNGAHALGFGEELGTIETGKRAELLAVAIPDGVEDVEEYLVAGRVQPPDIRWLPSEAGGDQ